MDHWVCRLGNDARLSFWSLEEGATLSERALGAALENVKTVSLELKEKLGVVEGRPGNLPLKVPEGLMLASPLGTGGEVALALGVSPLMDG